MNALQRVYYFFSRYANPDERRVGRFLSRITEKSPTHKVERGLVDLLQHNTPVINLWTEHRYKNYTYLTKTKRRELYANLAAIYADFEAFCASRPADEAAALTAVRQLGVDTAALSANREQFLYVTHIMAYLSPQNRRYEYRATSSFGRLLQNPTLAVMQGDCNQIVTLYLALYAQKYPVSDMKLTVFPGHVALHFFGVDVEATTGRFMSYDKPGQTRPAISELVSINLLDTSDSNFETSSVTPEAFLESARLAYTVSSHRKIVKGNLEAAYRKMAHHLMNRQQYKRALSYADQGRDYELIQAVAHNAAVYELKQKNFTAARRFASRLTNKQELYRTINQHEAVDLFRAKQYETARKLYEHIGDTNMVKQCYRGLYNLEQQKLGSVKTVADVKSHAGIIRSMERYAKQANDDELMKHAASLAKYL